MSEEALRVVTGSMFDYFMIGVLEHKKEFDELNTSHSNIESFIKGNLKNNGFYNKFYIRTYFERLGELA